MSSDHRYNQREIEGIIGSGSIKQRALLYLRDRMGFYGAGFILSYNQVDRLSLSVSDPDKRRRWVDYISFGLRIENGFKDIELNLRTLTRVRGELGTLLRMIQDFELIEVTMNKLLTPGEPALWDGDMTDRERISQTALDFIRDKRIPSSGFNYIRPSLDENNHLDLGLTGDKSLTEKAKEKQEDLRALLEDCLCYEVALRKRIKESKLIIPEYEVVLKKFREILETPVSFNLRFRGAQDNRVYLLEDDPDKQEKEFPFPALRDLIEDYSVRVDDIDLKSDESLDKINNFYNQI